MTQTTLQTRRRKPKAQLEEIPPVPEFPNISLLEEDGEPLESDRHVLQIHLLIDLIYQHWHDCFTEGQGVELAVVCGGVWCGGVLLV
ncbi:MAG: hypothetical protein C4336_08575 [Armatimonadota bacterium]